MSRFYRAVFLVSEAISRDVFLPRLGQKRKHKKKKLFLPLLFSINTYTSFVAHGMAYVDKEKKIEQITKKKYK